MFSDIQSVISILINFGLYYLFNPDFQQQLQIAGQNIVTGAMQDLTLPTADYPPDAWESIPE